MRNQPTSRPPSRPPTRSPRVPANPYQQARRKRALKRRFDSALRHFEGVVARLPVPTDWGAQLQGITVPAVLHPTPWHYSKALSGLLCVAALVTVVLLHTQDQWFVYREDVRFQQINRVDASALFAAADVDGWNVLWLEPAAIRARLLAQPWVADAQVRVQLPRDVTITVQEELPVAVWITNQGQFWLSSSGAALPIPINPDGSYPPVALPQIVDSLNEARAIGDGPLRMDPAILTSALALMEALPELEDNVRYNRTIGLNFALRDPAIWVYWGDGFAMPAKLDNLTAIRAALRTRPEPAQFLDLRSIDRPYVR